VSEEYDLMNKGGSLLSVGKPGPFFSALKWVTQSWIRRIANAAIVLSEQVNRGDTR